MKEETDIEYNPKEEIKWIYEDTILDKLRHAKEKNAELQQRIDKAISLLKEAGCYDEETKTFCDDVWEELPDLLNILQGEDTNVKDKR